MRVNLIVDTCQKKIKLTIHYMQSPRLQSWHPITKIMMLNHVLLGKYGLKHAHQLPDYSGPQEDWT
jgi:hypothetical protein